MKRRPALHIVTLSLLFSLSTGLAACTTTSTHETSSLKPSTEWVAHAPDWRQEALDVYEEASEYVKIQSEKNPALSWAVILDLDETVMNNVAYQVARDKAGLGYTSESWYEWTQKKQASLVPGAAEFIAVVNQLGGHVAFVTNRRDPEQLATEENLAALGLWRSEDFRVLLTKASPNGRSDKTSRFNLVPEILAAQGYPNVEVIAFIGDNIGDKPETAKGWKFFCIDQGAMYGEPCAAVPGPGR